MSIQIDVDSAVVVSRLHTGNDGLQGIDYAALIGQTVGHVLESLEQIADVLAATLLDGIYCERDQKAYSFGVFEDELTDEAVDEADEVATSVI